MTKSTKCVDGKPTETLCVLLMSNTSCPDDNVIIFDASEGNEPVILVNIEVMVTINPIGVK